MVLHSCVGSINFTDPANIRQTHKALLSHVRKEAIIISKKYIIPIEPIQFECDKFLPTLEKYSLDILSKVLTQQYQSNSNINSSMPNENRNQYNTVVGNRTRTLTSLSPSYKWSMWV